MKKSTPSKVVIVTKPSTPTTSETAPQADTVIKTNSTPEPPKEEDPEESNQAPEESEPAPKA